MPPGRLVGQRFQREQGPHDYISVRPPVTEFAGHYDQNRSVSRKATSGSTGDGRGSCDAPQLSTNGTLFPHLNAEGLHAGVALPPERERTAQHEAVYPRHSDERAVNAAHPTAPPLVVEPEADLRRHSLLALYSPHHPDQRGVAAIMARRWRAGPCCM